jgi:hypothetical protein
MSNAKCQMPKNPAAFDAAWAAGLHAPAIRVTRPAAPPPAKKQTIIDDTPRHHPNITRRQRRHYQKHALALQKTCIGTTKTRSDAMAGAIKPPVSRSAGTPKHRLALKNTLKRQQKHALALWLALSKPLFRPRLALKNTSFAVVWRSKTPHSRLFGGRKHLVWRSFGARKHHLALENTSFALVWRSKKPLGAIKTTHP